MTSAIAAAVESLRAVVDDPATPRVDLARWRRLLTIAESITSPGRRGRGRPRIADHDAIRSLRAQGMTYAAIARLLSLPPSTVREACIPVSRTPGDRAPA